MRRVAILLAFAPLGAFSQATCPSVNFLTPRTASLKPTATSHIDVIRQSDGSYTGFESADSSPYRVITAAPHFERQFAPCLPHTLPATPSAAAPNANPPGAGAQFQASALLASGNYFKATLGNQGAAVVFDLFDPQDNLLSESSFSYSVNVGPGNRTDVFNALALADMNGDGKLDLVAVFSTNRINAEIDGGVWIFPGNGDGTFGTGTRSVLTGHTELSAVALTIAIADLNGDGRPDIFYAAPYDCCGGFYGAPVIALANGDGTFTTSAGPSVLGVSAVAIGDLNGDGKPDAAVIAIDESGTTYLAILTGDGKGHFTLRASYAAALPSLYVNSSLAGLAIGDLNGDGIPDIATSMGTILFGDGKGNFPVRQDYTSNASGSVMIADFDGDGIPDIIYGNGNPTFLTGSPTDTTATVLFGLGKGMFAGSPASSAGLSMNDLTPFAIADFNGDGVPDAVVPQAAKSILQLNLLPGIGDGRFSPDASPQTFAAPANTSALFALAADFNHDSKTDLAVLLSGGLIQIFPGNGNGTFAAPLPLTLPDDEISLIAAVDVNGDGIPDLIAWSSTNLFVSLGKGDGTFAQPSFTLAVSSPGIVWGDFNGDGKPDIAVANAAAKTISVYLGKGDGTFPNKIVSPLPFIAFGAPGSFGFPALNSLTAADFDGDGRLDIAVAAGAVATPPSATQLTTTLLFGLGNGTFANPRENFGLLNAIAADFNRDGIPDLVGYIYESGLFVRLGNGDGTFQPDVLIGPEHAGIFAVGDLNRDGTPDIAVVGTTGITSFLNLSAPEPALTVVSAASFAAGPLAPDSFAAAFGEHLAPASSLSSSAFTVVTVRDSAGVARTAQIYYVSPGQVNFLIPAATAPGPATVSIGQVPFGKTFSTTVQIAPLAPALFSGASLQLGSYLVLFGTGFDSATAANTIATIQGIAAQVAYGGPQPTIPGLDQINLLIPSSLIGAGSVTIALSVAGQTANLTIATIQ